MFNFSNLKNDADTYTYVRNLTIATVLLQTAGIIAFLVAPTLLAGWVYLVATLVPMLPAFLVMHAQEPHLDLNAFTWFLLGNGVVYTPTAFMLIPSIITTALLAITVIYMVTTPQSNSIQSKTQQGQDKIPGYKDYTDPPVNSGKNPEPGNVPRNDGDATVRSTPCVII